MRGPTAVCCGLFPHGYYVQDFSGTLSNERVGTASSWFSSLVSCGGSLLGEGRRFFLSASRDHYAKFPVGLFLLRGPVSVCGLLPRRFYAQVFCGALSYERVGCVRSLFLRDRYATILL